MLCLWSAKGGAGCTVTSAAVSLLAARHDETLLVDLAGDSALALGLLAAERPMEGSRLPANGAGAQEVWPEDPEGPATGEDMGWGIAGWLEAPCPPPDSLARSERPLSPGLSLLPWGAGPPLTSSSPSPSLASLSLSTSPSLASSASPSPSAGSAERVAILARLLAEDERRVVVDLGLGAGGRPWWQEPFLDLARASILVTRACYLSLNRAFRHRRPDGVVLIEEPGRALTAADVAAALGVPVLAAVPCDPAVARAVDAGLLRCRLPRSLRGLQPLVDGPGIQW